MSGFAVRNGEALRARNFSNNLTGRAGSLPASGRRAVHDGAEKL
jgi:hypothetical protein